MGKQMKLTEQNLPAARGAVRARARGIAAVMLLLAGAIVLIGADREPASRPASAPAGRRVIYQHPHGVGTPPGRISGASRGADDQSPRLVALVPRNLPMYTVSEHPALFWQLSKDTDLPARMTVRAINGNSKPIIDRIIGGPKRAGVQRFELAIDGAPSLQPDLNYEWIISLLQDEESPDKNPFAGGFIRRIPVDDSLKADLQRCADDVERAAAFASHGIWYDAQGALQAGMQNNPPDEHARDEWEKLLADEDLKSVAGSQSQR